MESLILGAVFIAWIVYSQVRINKLSKRISKNNVDIFNAITEMQKEINTLKLDVHFIKNPYKFNKGEKVYRLSHCGNHIFETIVIDRWVNKEYKNVYKFFYPSSGSWIEDSVYGGYKTYMNEAEYKQYLIEKKQKEKEQKKELKTKKKGVN